ncbi:hypothetical protein MMYC01_210614, partial [Madurella mycetomatis]
VDSLCILQGCQQDWLMYRKEIGSIYVKSHVTIAAADDVNSRTGCFIPHETEQLKAPNIGHFKSGYYRQGRFITPNMRSCSCVGRVSGASAMRALPFSRSYQSRRVSSYYRFQSQPSVEHTNQITVGETLSANTRGAP